MQKEAWKKAQFVEKSEEQEEKKCKDVGKLLAMGINKASVVPIGWLLEQLIKCSNHDQDTIRIASDKNGRIYIESYADAEDIDGCSEPPGADPPGWNNDWPEIGLP